MMKRKKLLTALQSCTLLLFIISQASGAGSNPRNVSSTECHPENGEFLCTSEHECIKAIKFCDKKIDCSDGSDEFSGCDKLCKDLKCDHGCLPDPDEPTTGMCSCQEGFKISGRRREKCINIDECTEKWGICSQRCEDTEGSFKCSCIAGFELQSNNRTCAPKDQSAKMLFAVKNGIRSISLATRKEKVVAQRSGQTVGVTVDVARGLVYWTDVTDRMEAIYRARVDGSTEPQVIVDTGLVLAEGVAFDWIADNIYFTDSNLSHIGVCDRDGKSCTILVQEIVDKPREIALLPEQGLMFWTDWGSEPSIVKGGMDGSHPVAIVRSELRWPNGLVVDLGGMRLYWIDAAHDKIESSDLEGGDRRIIRESPKGEHGFNLEIFGDTLYWSDWGMDRIASCDKFHGEEDDVLLSAPINLINGIALFHSSAQPKAAVNPCKRQGCTHICVIAPASAPFPYKCLCPVGMRLSSDGKTCKDNTARPQLFIAHEASLKRMYFNSIGHDVLLNQNLEGLRTISAITYNRLNDTFILFDTYRKNIFTYIPSTHKIERLVTRHLDHVKGLDVDVVSQNLYWVDAGRRKVEVYSLKTGARLNIFHETVDTLVDIIAVPEFRSLFVAAYDTFGGKILKMTMNGDSVDVILQTSRGIPSSLAYHPEYEHIFWSDINKGTIEHATIDGRQRFMGVEEINSPYTMTVHGNKMYWIERSNKALKSMIIGSHSRDPPMNIRSANQHLNGSLPGNFSAYLGVRNPDLSLLKDLMETHPCSPSSKTPAGCSHICVLSDLDEFGGACLCPEGMVLSSDGKTCEPLVECNRSLFQCIGSCISLEAECDGFKDCPGGEDESQCKKNVTCRPSDFVCKSDNTCVQNLWRCDGEKDCHDGSDEENCPKTECPNPTDFRCQLGRCLPAAWRCDHVVDCPDTDATDEVNCPYTCLPGEFKCKSSKECIPNDWVCDEDEDCQDGSDEHSECLKECKKDQYKCQNHQCIRKSKVCNGRDDCGDGSDEASCPSPASRRSQDSSSRRSNSSTTTAPRRNPCPSDKFWCLSGECISLRLVCDGKSDCFDESDESEKCDMPCGMANDCADKCVSTPSGPKCSCGSGFRLGEDKKSCEDIDECSTNPCHHYCQNLKGGYKCTCHNEYSPKPADHKSCKPKGSPPLFIYDSKSRIFVTSQDMLNTTAISLPSTVTGLDVDIHTGAIFFTNAVNGTIARTVINSTQEPEILVTGLSSPTEIAYDWTTENAYVVCNLAGGREEARLLTISICNLGKEGKKRKCAPIHRLHEVHQVTSLAIAPAENYIFWTQLVYTNVGFTQGEIVSAPMGRPGGARFISSEKVYHPVSITVDHVFKRVFWIDTEKKAIEAVNFDGKSRTTIIDSDEKKVSERAYGLGLYDNWLIWNDDGKNIRCRIDMQTGECMHVKIPNAPQSRFSIIMQRTRQPTGINPCENNTCEYICAGNTATGHTFTSSSSSSSSTKISYKCFCPIGYNNLDDHHRKCVPKPRGKSSQSIHVHPARRPATKDEDEGRSAGDNPDEDPALAAVSSEPLDSDSTTVVVVTVIVVIVLICLIAGAIVVYRQRSGRPKLAIRPYVQQWVKYVNDPVQRWRGNRREQLTDPDAYAQVYDANNDHAYQNPVYEEVQNSHLKKSDDGSKGEPRSYPDSGILTLENDAYDFEDDINNGHYVSYSQTDNLLDKEFV